MVLGNTLLWHARVVAALDAEVVCRLHTVITV
jgi:hypothetical protein